MAFPLLSFTVPEIVRVEAVPSLKVSELGVFPPLVGTVICWSGTDGMPGLNTPTRYVPGMTLMEKAPEVLVCPPLPKPRSELAPPEVLEIGRAKTPAFETALPAESRTEPAMVFDAAVSVKSLPVTELAPTTTERFGGGMKVKVGGGGGGAPGVKCASGIAGPTPTL